MNTHKTNSISFVDASLWRKTLDEINQNWYLWLNSVTCITCEDGWELRFNHRVAHRMLKFLRARGHCIVTDGNSQFYKMLS